MTSFNVKAIMKELKTDPMSDSTFGSDTTFKEDEMIASQISSETHFNYDKPEFYYFVREPVDDTQFVEGFAKTMVLESEIPNGVLCVDGDASRKFDIGYGDQIHITSRPEHRLKCI